jgi:hypothetical protein
MFKRLWLAVSKRFSRPEIDPEVVAWYGIQASKGKKPVGWVNPQPYLKRDQLFKEGFIPLEGQQLADLQQYPELVAHLMGQGVSQLPDRRVWI